MATSTTVATTWTPATGSPYSPLKNGRIIQLRLFFAQTAATSVIALAHVKLESPLWGVPLIASIQGSGILTAPAEACIPLPLNCDAQVLTGNPIVVSVMHSAGIAAVTPVLTVVGVFEG